MTEKHPLTYEAEINGATRPFRFTIDGLRAVENAAGPADGAENTGIMVVYRQMLEARASALTIRTALIEGLKGGGEVRPGPIVDAYLADYPLGDALVVAEKALSLALFGPAE